MPRSLAGTLVFATSAAVLVIETLGVRLLAPYVGVTLETFTAIIGTALSGIALGTWAGGALADRVEPRRLLGPQLVLGGALTLLVVPVVRAIGPTFAAADPVSLLALAVLSVFPPAAVLSSVSPTVVKATLDDLGQTGRVVGKLSGLGTTGAIFGTFVTGFLLVAALPTPAILVVLGGLLTVAGTVLWLALRRQPLALLLPLLAVGAAGGALTVALDGPCERESAYFCARVLDDGDRPSGRILKLDTLDHSYVDLEDDRHLAFTYTRMMAAVIETATAGPLDAVHIGGGGFTLPRWLAAERPGSTSVVLELDPELVDLARDELGLVTSPELRVIEGDARLGVRELAGGRADVVIGDAFGGLSVPWHLTTEEFTRQVEGLLRDDGLYVVNVIDRVPLRFLRAEAATLRQVFPHVAVLAPPDRFEVGGNFVLAASHRPLDVAATRAAAEDLGLDVEVVHGAGLDELVAGERPLRDDFAPVDQLISSGG